MKEELLYWLRGVWRRAKETPVLMGVNVVGTALALGTIMTAMMYQNSLTADFYPSSKRDRYLYVSTVNLYEKKGPGAAHWNCSPSYLKGLAKANHVEAMAMMDDACRGLSFSVPGEARTVTLDARGVNGDFWRVFDWDFIQGAGFSEAEVEAGVGTVVIGERLAKEFFGDDNAVGREVEVNYYPMKVCGVVRDVSSYVKEAYAEVWYPYSAMKVEKSGNSPLQGPLAACFLVDSKSNMGEARASIEELAQRQMESEEFLRLDLLGQPDGQYAYKYRTMSRAPEVTFRRAGYWTLVVLMLLIPTVNLATVSGALLRRRRNEMGVRRIYGAQPQRLVWQMCSENFVYTLAGGALGLLLAIVAAYVVRDAFYVSVSYRATLGAVAADRLPVGALLSVKIFFQGLLLCVAFNLLSTLLPAVRAARRPVVESLK